MSLKFGSTIVVIPTTVKEAFQKRYQEWCWRPPNFKCSRYKIEFRTVPKNENKTKTTLEKRCCDGYRQRANRCEPKCEQECEYGTCSAPDKCTCNQGYSGALCNIECGPMKWGLNCTQDCICQNGGVCDTNTGECKCARGFIGEECQNKCPVDKFGDQCEEICRCENDAECSHVNGECTCKPGWKGPL